LLMYEADLNYNQGGGQLPGTLKFGAWRFFGSFEQQSVGNNGLRSASWGFPACSPRRTTASTPFSIR
jgi:hypothetical protein